MTVAKGKTTAKGRSGTKPTAPRSDACVLHVDCENYEDNLVGLLNAGVRWLGEPFVPGEFGTTEVTKGFAFAGKRALFAESTKRKQRAQIRLGKRFDAPKEPGPCVMEFVYRPVKSKPVTLSDWIVWQPLGSDWTPGLGIELRATGGAKAGTYAIYVRDLRHRGRR